jgi:hypothetical protein
MDSFESDLSEIKRLLQSIDTSVALQTGSTRNDAGQHERQGNSQDGEDTAMVPNVGSFNSFIYTVIC